MGFEGGADFQPVGRLNESPMAETVDPPAAADGGVVVGAVAGAVEGALAGAVTGVFAGAEAGAAAGCLAADGAAGGGCFCSQPKEAAMTATHEINAVVLDTVRFLV